MLWKFCHLFLGNLAILYKTIKKKWREATSLNFCKLQFQLQSKNWQIKFSSHEFYLEEKQHSDLVCIWWLSFINGKAVSLCTELRLGLASVLIHCTLKGVKSFLPISVFWKMSLWNVVLPAKMWINPSARKNPVILCCLGQFTLWQLLI